MAGNDEDIQQMYEYQQLKGIDGEEYVVRGAVVCCNQGSKDCILQLPVDHGFETTDGRPLILNTDVRPENIAGFGQCKRYNGGECQVALLSWAINEHDLKMDNMDNKDNPFSYAVEKNSTAVCVREGIVSFKTSGQTSPNFNNSEFDGAEEVIEDIEKSWVRATDGKDFLGHIKVENSGLYNLGFGYGNIEIKGNLGSVFLYKKSGGKLKYIGAYEIKKTKATKRAKFFSAEYQMTGKEITSFNTWIGIFLESKVDYYVEFDCPSVNRLSYWLVGNQEISEIDNYHHSSGIWFFNEIFKQRYSDQYALLRLQYTYAQKGLPIVIMYLAEEYSQILLAFVAEMAVSDINITGDASNVLSVLSFGAGKVTVIKKISKLLEEFVEFVGILGEMFGVIALILAFMPKPVLERLRDELARNQRTFVKVTLLDVSPDNRRPSKGKYNIQAFKVEKHPEYINRKIDIYGEKYFLGGFGWLKKTDSWKKLNETLDNFLKKIKENY